MLKNVISERKSPDKTILNSLLGSYSRKFKVNKKDLNDATEVIDDLIREVYDTSFISAESKYENAEQLLKILSPEPKTDEEIPEREISSISKISINGFNSSISPLIMLLTSAITLAVFFISTLKNDYSFKSALGLIGYSQSSTLILATILSFIIVLTAFNVASYFKKFRKIIFEENDIDIKIMIINNIDKYV